MISKKHLSNAEGLEDNKNKIDVTGTGRGGGGLRGKCAVAGCKVLYCYQITCGVTSENRR